MSWLPRTLVGRVAWTCAALTLVAGTLVALVSSIIAAKLTYDREDEFITGAAETLGFELRAPDADPFWIVEDETHELAHADLQFAIYDGTRLLTGARELGYLAPGTCGDLGPRRGCARSGGRWIAVAARRPIDVEARIRAVVISGAVAALITSVLGALVALTVGRTVLRPLARLHVAVQRLPPDPVEAHLGDPERVLEVDALRDSLRSAFERLGASLAQSRRFASDAAHELRTPLTTILGELELGAERADGEARVGLLRSHRVALRLAALVERLLILARLEAPTTLERVDLGEVVEDALEALSPDARQRVQVELRTQPSPWVLGDQPLLVAMLGNGVENALKFSSGPVRIELAADQARATIAIEDDGPGVAAADREKVFLPFFRTRESRAGSVPGHGIGLALIAHVVALHRGEVRFADVRAGARLEILLARVDPSRDSSPVL